MGLNQTYDCSSSVVSNASNNIIKYLIKYSDIENSIQCLEQLDFSANYMQLLAKFRKNMGELYLKPVFRFSYVSPAGKSSRTCKIKITTDIVRELQFEISAKVNKSGHSKTQRSAMTNDLREAIKKRDNYTCCLCGNSVFNEPNLLLEVDHIIPISKGGKTEASNLQTLCWRCNRAKRDNL